MKRNISPIIALILTGIVAACSPPIVEEEAVILEPILEAPILKLPHADCDTAPGGIDDGIGGTGCQIN